MHTVSCMSPLKHKCRPLITLQDMYGLPGAATEPPKQDPAVAEALRHLREQQQLPLPSSPWRTPTTESSPPTLEPQPVDLGKDTQSPAQVDSQALSLVGVDELSPNPQIPGYGLQRSPSPMESAAEQCSGSALVALQQASASRVPLSSIVLNQAGEHCIPQPASLSWLGPAASCHTPVLTQLCGGSSPAIPSIVNPAQPVQACHRGLGALENGESPELSQLSRGLLLSGMCPQMWLAGLSDTVANQQQETPLGGSTAQLSSPSTTTFLWNSDNRHLNGNGACP